MSLLEDCNRLLSHDGNELSRARSLLELFGDDLRRTIIERLAVAPRSDLQGFARLTAAAPADISHRLRSLLRSEVVTRDRHFGHRVRPEALKVLSRYFNLLQLVSARAATR